MNRIKTTVLTPIAFAIFCKQEYAADKAARIRHAEAKAYNAMIAKSQAKIGPYVPQPCPVQIWA